ncbi:MAG: hypothetical protein IJQ07_06750 [Clostridia bacterium]|nr:hypothetical protein [Clostridia bacterium]
MANVDVTLGAVQKAKKSCVDAAKELNAAAKNLAEKYAAAGNGWKDSKYRELGDIVKTCNDAMKSPMAQLQECHQTLAELESIIIEYQNA